MAKMYGIFTLTRRKSPGKQGCSTRERLRVGKRFRILDPRQLSAQTGVDLHSILPSGGEGWRPDCTPARLGLYPPRTSPERPRFRRRAGSRDSAGTVATERVPTVLPWFGSVLPSKIRREKAEIPLDERVHTAEGLPCHRPQSVPGDNKVVMFALIRKRPLNKQVLTN